MKGKIVSLFNSKMIWAAVNNPDTLDEYLLSNSGHQDFSDAFMNCMLAISFCATELRSVSEEKNKENVSTFHKIEQDYEVAIINILSAAKYSLSIDLNTYSEIGSGYPILIEAVANDASVDLIRGLASIGVDLLTKGFDGRTALMECVNNVSQDTMVYLLSQNLSPTEEDEEGYTALSFAAIAGRTDAMDVLWSAIEDQAKGQQAQKVLMQLKGTDKETAQYMMDHVRGLLSQSLKKNLEESVFPEGLPPVSQKPLNPKHKM